MLYTGLGSTQGNDGIFTREQKWASKHTSGLTRDEFDLYANAPVNNQAHVGVDSEMRHEDD